MEIQLKGKHKFNKVFNYLVILGKKRFKEIACITKRQTRRRFTNNGRNRKAFVKFQVNTD